MSSPGDLVGKLPGLAFRRYPALGAVNGDSLFTKGTMRLDPTQEKHQ